MFEECHYTIVFFLLLATSWNGSTKTIPLLIALGTIYNIPRLQRMAIDCMSHHQNRHECILWPFHFYTSLVFPRNYTKSSLKISFTTAINRPTMTMTNPNASYVIRQVASRFTLEYRAYLADATSGRILSPFHDIPLWANKEAGILNMIVEVPRFSNAKLEISKEEWMNPIKQDVKKGALRFVKNCFPYHGYLWNYGALPQTWESPRELDGDTGLKGDNDPLDVLEIGSQIGFTGQVKQVKVLGAMALIDEGETDWKILAIDVEDPLAKDLHDTVDVERLCPGLIEATRRWFEIYKVPDGKGYNSFAFDGAVRDRSTALRIIADTHHMWQALITGEVPAETDQYKISIANRQVAGSLETLSLTAKDSREQKIFDDASQKHADTSLPINVNDWHYVNNNSNKH